MNMPSLFRPNPNARGASGVTFSAAADDDVDPSPDGDVVVPVGSLPQGLPAGLYAAAAADAGFSACMSACVYMVLCYFRTAKGGCKRSKWKRSIMKKMRTYGYVERQGGSVATGPGGPGGEQHSLVECNRFLP